MLRCERSEPRSSRLGLRPNLWLALRGPALRGALDHDDFGLNQSKIIVIEGNDLEHDVIAKVYQLWRIML